MNPIQVNCPECQKMFFVRSEDLTAGLVRFQCTACQVIFGFHWPQEPGVTVVRSQLLERPQALAAVTSSVDRSGVAASAQAQASVQASVQTATHAIDAVLDRAADGAEATSAAVQEPPASAKVFAQAGKPTRTCINCHSQVEYKYLECPKCGIIFDKVKRLRPPEPAMPAASQEITQAWEAVKANYDDHKRHEAFIQLCLAKENLVFASSQYRSILQVNPTEETATKMQNRIIEMATMAYVAQAQVARANTPKRSMLSNIVLFVGTLLIATGLAVPQARSLMALGASLIAFVIALRYFSRG